MVDAALMNTIADEVISIGGKNDEKSIEKTI
jgi:hypothetical protein